MSTTENQMNADFIVMSSRYKGSDRREAARRSGDPPVTVRFHRPTALLTALAILTLAAFGYFVQRALQSVDEPSIRATPARAVGAVTPGEQLLVAHGIIGQCPHADGGMIIVQAMPQGGLEWRLIKRITAAPANLEPGRALSRWTIPANWAPGGYEGRITVWCYGEPAPLRSRLKFSVK